MGGWQGLDAGKTVVLKNERGKCINALGQVISHSGLKLAEIKGNFEVYSTSQGCTAIKDNISIPDHLNGLPLCFRKQPEKADH